MTLRCRIQWYDVTAQVVRALVRRSTPMIGLVSLVVICFAALPAAAQEPPEPSSHWLDASSTNGETWDRGKQIPIVIGPTPFDDAH